MTTIALGSICGSPGATRLAIGLAAAWPEPRRRILVEADADGGRLGAELGVGTEPGLMAVALAARSGRLDADEVVERGAAAAGDWFVVPAPPSSEQAHSALAHVATTIADVTVGSSDTWIVDAGRLSTRCPAFALARSADLVLVVTGGSFAELQLVPHRVDALRRAGCAVELVVVEPTSWGAAEIAEFACVDVAAVVPFVKTRDHRVAAMRGTAWRTWWRVVDRLAAHCAGRHEPAPDAETAMDGRQ